MLHVFTTSLLLLRAGLVVSMAIDSELTSKDPTIIGNTEPERTPQTDAPSNFFASLAGLPLTETKPDNEGTELKPASEGTEPNPESEGTNMDSTPPDANVEEPPESVDDGAKDAMETAANQNDEMTDNQHEKQETYSETDATEQDDMNPVDEYDNNDPTFGVEKFNQEESEAVLDDTNKEKQLNKVTPRTTSTTTTANRESHDVNESETDIKLSGIPSPINKPVSTTTPSPDERRRQTPPKRRKGAIPTPAPRPPPTDATGTRTVTQ